MMKISHRWRAGSGGMKKISHPWRAGTIFRRFRQCCQKVVGWRWRDEVYLKICDINVVQVATFMFRYVNNLLPSSFVNYFVLNSDIYGYDTRHCKDIHLTYFRTNLRGSCIQINGLKFWNAIPVLIKNAMSVHAFKRKFIGTIYKE